MNDLNQIKVDYVDINVLKPSTYNPRRWDLLPIKNLTESIQKYGLVDPVIANKAKNRYGILIGGHFRYKVSKDLGMKQIPVIWLDIADIEREKELNLRLNKNIGDWDYDLLKEFDPELLMNIGFDENELSHIWDEQLSVEDDQFDVEKELEKIKQPLTKTGDIYRLGKHLLICADSTKICVNTKNIEIAYCDPPYNIGLDYDKGIGAKRQYGGKTNDSKSEKEYAIFIRQCIENLLPVLKKDSHLFFWCDQAYVGLIQTIYKQLGIVYKRTCLWIKNGHNPTPQIAFNKSYEPVVYGIIGEPYIAPKVTNLNEVLNKEVGTGNRLTDDILDMLDIWLVKRLSSDQYEHPTQKPPSLHEKALRRCSKPGDTVIDLFGGSGSTLIACEQLKRKAIIVEIEPIFCDLIISRYKELTGEEAIHVNKIR